MPNQGNKSKGQSGIVQKKKTSTMNFERRAVGHQGVLIEIRYCGVCHTDIHFLRNDLGFSVYPLTPSHEIVGIVLEPKVM